MALVLPHRIITNILEGLEILNKIIPGVSNDDTLLYGPEIKFFSNEIETDNNFNLWADYDPTIRALLEEALGLVKEHNAEFFAVSAVNGIGIKEMFEKIVYEYIVENDQGFQKEDINKNLVLNNQMLTYQENTKKKKCC